jgi:hypothetical protein
VKLSFIPTAKGTEYGVYLGNSTGSTWALNGMPKRLDGAIWVESTTFVDEAPTDGRKDIVFQQDGTIPSTAYHTKTESGKEVAVIVLRTKAKIPKNQYTLYLQPNGTVQSVGSNY